MSVLCNYILFWSAKISFSSKDVFAYFTTAFKNLSLDLVFAQIHMEDAVTGNIPTCSETSFFKKERILTEYDTEKAVVNYSLTGLKIHLPPLIAAKIMFSLS